MPSLPRPAAVAALLLLAVPIAVLAAVWFGQRRLLYFPVAEPLPAAIAAARTRGLEPWLDGAGRFLGWRAPARGAPAARALVLHGNAGSALDRVYLRDVLQGPRFGGGAGGVEVLLLEYPGYGPRPGAPGEETIVAAAVEAIDLLGGTAPVLLVGESLGSAVAAQAAAARPAVAGVLLLTPLAGVAAVAQRHYPFIPSLLVRDTYRTDRALARYRGRAGFLVAGRDEVVFADLGRALFEGHAGPKRLWVEPGAFHNTLRYDPADPLWGEVWGFLAGPG